MQIHIVIIIICNKRDVINIRRQRCGVIIIIIIKLAIRYIYYYYIYIYTCVLCIQYYYKSESAAPVTTTKNLYVGRSSRGYCRERISCRSSSSTHIIINIIIQTTVLYLSRAPSILFRFFHIFNSSCHRHRFTLTFSHLYK